jgi:GT2 family glycosyltransferase
MVLLMEKYRYKKYVFNCLNPDYVLLLNNDTVHDLEFLGELVKTTERSDDIGFVVQKLTSTTKKILSNLSEVQMLVLNILLQIK